jgi:hypothetical protein
LVGGFFEVIYKFMDVPEVPLISSTSSFKVTGGHKMGADMRKYQALTGGLLIRKPGNF